MKGILRLINFVSSTLDILCSLDPDSPVLSVFLSLTYIPQTHLAVILSILKSGSTAAHARF